MTRKATPLALRRRLFKLGINLQVDSGRKYNAQSGVRSNGMLAEVWKPLGLPGEPIDLQATAHAATRSVTARFPKGTHDDIITSTLAHEAAHIILWDIGHDEPNATLRVLIDPTARFNVEQEASRLAYELMMVWGYEVTDVHIAMWNLSLYSYAKNCQTINFEDWRF